MRKRIASLLACVLFFTTLQSTVSLQAADTEDATFGFQMTKQILSEQAQGLELLSKDDSTQETALAKWDIDTAGSYKMIYHVEANGASGSVETKRVELNFDVDGTNNVVFNANTYTGGVLDTNNRYVRREFNSSNNTWAPTTTSSVINATLKKGTGVQRSLQEYNTIVENISMPMDKGKIENLSFRVKIVDKQLIVYTNGIRKGNMTGFDLQFKNAGGTTYNSKAAGRVFNGPKNYKITPTHLVTSGAGLDSKTMIEDPLLEKPGSKPGVKISFDKIKSVQGEAFTAISSASTDKVTLLLGPEFTLGNMTQGIRLDFVPDSGKDVQINQGGVVSGAVNTDPADSNKIILYMSKDTTGLPATVIKWDILDKSMIVNGSFEYANTGDKFWPNNKGYTYLEYAINKTSGNQAKLDITPYNIKSKATYKIYVASTETSFTSEPQMVYEYDPNKTNNTSISTIVPTQSPSYFKIEVEIDKNIFTSQIVHYIPDKFNAIPEVTQIKTIDNVYVVPKEDANDPNGQPQAIGFDIEWRAPQNLTEILAKGDLYYELLLHTDKDSAKSDTTYSKIFRVYLDTATNKPVVVCPANMGTAGGDFNTNPSARYSLSDQTFTMENVSLKNYSKSGWERLNVSANHLTTNGIGYIADSTVTDDLANRVVPGTYYLSFRTIFVDKDTTKQILYSGESNKASLSLDTVKEIIPVPGNISGQDTTDKDKTSIQEKIRFSHVDIEQFVKKMLEPAKKSLDNGAGTGRYQGEYEIYLYQKKDKLTQRAAEIKADATLARHVTTGSIIDLSQTVNGKTDIERLRDGDVVPLILSADSLRGVGSAELEFKGLDPNQVYYISIRTRLNPWQNGVKLTPEYSLFSNEFSFTTTTKPIPPTPDDKVPPAPEKIWIIEQPNNNTATLGWEKADFEPDADVTKTYYEFIRSAKQMTTEEKTQSVETLVGADQYKVGFRSDSPDANEPYINTYLNTTKTWTRLTPNQLSSAFKLTDSTLNPNNVYYYYVRTVCVIKGQTVKSTWIMVPVTTAPVSPPINLKVESPKDYSYDTKKQTVISFDAPIPAGASIPANYEFEIAIQGENDTEYSTTKYTAAQITTGQIINITPTGYTHYVYRISNLKPNKRYDIKVRIKDKTKPLAAGESYPTSLYCDKVTTRTDYDQASQDGEEAYAEYLKKFDAAVEKLRRRPYWTVEKGTHYKYRDSYIGTEVAVQSEYELISDKDESEAYYYMPASALRKASEAGTVLKIVLGNQTVNIRPDTLTEENEQVKRAIKLMNENELADYYIGIHVSTDDYSGTVNGEKTISPEINIDVELVYMAQEDVLTEDDIMAELDNLIKAERIDFISALEKKIDKGKIADDVLQDLVDDAVSDIESDHIKKVEKIMKNEKKKTVTVDEIEKAILIIAKSDSIGVNGYYSDGSRWENIPTYMAGEGFALEAVKLGAYIFTGQKPLIDTVPEVAAYQNAISKYNLSDFFKMDNYSMNTVVTKEQVYGAVARMMGAPRGTDYSVYLKDNGIKGVTAIGLQRAIRQDEAIYIIMQGYEKIYDKPIAAIVIKNKQSVQNIGAFQPAYRVYVYAAVELKVVSNPNAKVLPSKQLSVKEVIKMLNKLQAK